MTNQSDLLLRGIGIGNYRSFGEDIQYIGPLTKINLIAGRNNTGKSNILRFMDQFFESAMAATKGGAKFQGMNDQDYRFRDTKRTLSVAIGVPSSTELTSTPHRSLLERLLSHLALEREPAMSWFPWTIGEDGSAAHPNKWLHEVKASLTDSEWSHLYRAFQQLRVGSTNQYTSACLDHLKQSIPKKIPKVELVPAFRKISNGTSDYFDGTNLVDQLAKLEKPDLDANASSKKERFRKVEKFAQSVLSEPQARIEVPYSRDTLNVTINGRQFSLEDLGTGVHETIILAAAATISNADILCLEEPEIHLHPGLQRKLLRYLLTQTPKQYLVATHSAHFLNEPEVSVFHCTLDTETESTQVSFVQSPTESAEIAYDLGYRPSDLVQTNCIIWVEGPSDRIYINHWIEAVNDELVEGIHYSIMFYGGRLLRHLSATDEAIEDFISLRRLNRHVAVVVDSDRERKGQRLGEAKLEIRKQLRAEDHGFFWETAGREIENYVTAEIIEEAAMQAHGSVVRKKKTGARYGRALSFAKSDGSALKNPNKVRIARHVTDHEPDLSILDLRDQTRNLVNFIENAQTE